MVKRRNFYALASLAFGIQASWADTGGLQIQDLVPKGAIPTGTDSVYAGVIADKNKTLTGGYTNAALADYRIPLGKALHSYTRYLRSLNSDQAQAEALSCLQVNCAYHKAQGDEGSEFQIKIAALEALRHQGYNSEELASIFSFHTTFSPPESYKHWEEERTDLALQAVISSGIFETFGRFKDFKDMTKADVSEQYYLRRNWFQKVANELCKAFDVEPVLVIPDVLPAELSSISGYEDSRGMTPGHVYINFAPFQGEYLNFDNFSIALETLVHEVKHNIDAKIAILVYQRKIVPDDVRYAHGAAILLNQQVYAMPKEDGALNLYREQYSERTAYSFAEAFMRKYSKAAMDYQMSLPYSTFNP